MRTLKIYHLFSNGQMHVQEPNPSYEDEMLLTFLASTLIHNLYCFYGCSRPEVFYKIKLGVSCLIKLQFIKRETLVQVFSCEFWEIFKSNYFVEHLRTVASGYISK